MKLIYLKDFSSFPAGRKISDGPFSAEAFRTQILVPALREKGMVCVCLDDTMGIASSFLEELFGGLVAIEGFSARELQFKLRIMSEEDETLALESWSYIKGRMRIFESIEAERVKQDKQWGGLSHDVDHDIDDWTRYIEKQLGNIKKSKSSKEHRERLVKIAALAVAALESLE